MRFSLRVKIFILCISLIAILLFMLYIEKPNLLRQDQHDFIRMVRRVNYLSEWDKTETFRITRFAANSIKPMTKIDATVTLVTQGSLNNIFHLIDLVNAWQGPISVSIFAEFRDVALTLQLLAKLRFCFRSISEVVNFHVVTHRGNGNVRDEVPPFIKCTEKFEGDTSYKNYALDTKYPVNLLRNVALGGVTTPFFLVIDIDMIPNPGLQKQFAALSQARPLDNTTAYIVPVFEVEAQKSFPRDKGELLGWKEAGLVRPFYNELCPHCQNCVNYERWLELPQQSALQIAYNISWKDPCEPFYIAARGTPPYEENFQQYGFNRISQLCELQMAGYTFTVLDNVFVLHLGFKTKDNFHATKDLEQKLNLKRYREFKIKMKYKYPSSNRFC